MNLEFSDASAKVNIRPIKSDDVELLWPYVSNPDISRDMSWDAHRNREETRAFVEDSVRKIKEMRAVTWCVFYDNTFCGIFSLISILRSHRSLTYDKAELAYWIGPQFQGKGIMTATGRLVLRFAFEELKLHKVVVGHHNNNERSKNLILRLGFTFLYEEREVFRKGNTWIDCKFYEISATNYFQNKQSMNEQATIFVSPDSHRPLFLRTAGDTEELVSREGDVFHYVDGFPELLIRKELSKKAAVVLDFYEGRADVYDKFLHQTFKTHNEDEIKVRNSFIDKLGITKESKVLEIACGTGRDSELIAQRLGKSGQLVLQDISPSMLKVCKSKLADHHVEKLFCISDAASLPFPTNYFDATYSFGGLGEFPDIRRSLAEMVRVTKVGGKVVVGDESMPPWLRDTYFSKVLTKTNPQFQAEVPLKDIPVDARKLSVQWVIGGVFYLIDFEVGDGEPKGNFDYVIEGPRGGTLRTRLEGELEGVTKEAKELAHKAAKAKGMSMHQWLDTLVREGAKKDLSS